MTTTYHGYRDASPMTQILDRLFLGGFANAEALAQANPHHITCIVNCTTEPLTLPKALGPRDSTGFQILQLNQLDAEPWDLLKAWQAVGWIHQQLRYGQTVLVHCHAGISRSPSLVAAYLYTCGWDFESALGRIRSKRPFVQPWPIMLESIRLAFGIPSVGVQTRR